MVRGRGDCLTLGRGPDEGTPAVSKTTRTARVSQPYKDRLVPYSTELFNTNFPAVQSTDIKIKLRRAIRNPSRYFSQETARRLAPGITCIYSVLPNKIIVFMVSLFAPVPEQRNCRLLRQRAILSGCGGARRWRLAVLTPQSPPYSSTTPAPPAANRAADVSSRCMQPCLHWQTSPASRSARPWPRPAG
jgi:hypothetical protein